MNDVNDRPGPETAADARDEAANAHVDNPAMAAIEADIAHTRADLAQTVDELAAKVDVKTRVRSRLTEVKADAIHQVNVLRARATDDEGKPTPAAMSIVGGVLAAAVAVLVMAWRRSNNRSHSSGRKRR